jgi:hypothetical protein
VTRHEPTAFHLARSGKGRDSYGSNGASIDAEQTQLELFLRGAKANVLNGSYPWTFWRGFDSAAKALGNSLKQPDFIKVDVPEGESLRALVVDIYSRSSVNALPSEEHTENKTGCLSEKDQEGQRQRYEEPDGAGGWAYESDPTQVSSANDNSFAEVELQPETGSDTGRETKETGKKQSKSHDKHEFHQIAFPTIEELIHTKGPRAILNPTLPDFPSGLKAEDYTKFRWIHLPMNHVRDTFDISLDASLCEVPLILSYR